MKALVWHGKHDVRCESVPNLAIQEPTDAVIYSDLRRGVTETFCSSCLE